MGGDWSLIESANPPESPNLQSFNLPISRGRSIRLHAWASRSARDGTDLVLALTNLSMLCGRISKPSTGVASARQPDQPMRARCDLGGLPNCCQATGQ